MLWWLHGPQMPGIMLKVCKQKPSSRTHQWSVSESRIRAVSHTFQLKSLFVSFWFRDSTFQHLNVNSVKSSMSEEPESATAVEPVICLWLQVRFPPAYLPDLPDAKKARGTRNVLLDFFVCLFSLSELSARTPGCIGAWLCMAEGGKTIRYSRQVERSVWRV